MTTAIVDYGRGNVYSLSQALEYLGTPHVTTGEVDQLLAARRVILPGVGAFGMAMEELRQRNLVEPLREIALRGTPLLGICLGMELLGTESEEFGVHEGLDLIPGKVRRLPDGDESADAIRIPNVGWRPIRVCTDAAPFSEIPQDSMFYFVHSYGFLPENPQHLSATVHVNGQDFGAIIQSDNLIGCQFHPENSAQVGLNVLQLFLGMDG